MQFTLADFIYNNSIEDRDEKKLNKTGFGMELEKVLYK